ncbi:WXG100 family type VII secretion target [Microcella daejeonensis]|uniref:WXG100 family type VII secretion target n=1 Tax=Microcella daejeonensis TaxID=2994971 RepID=A0A9E8MPE8_9MICO|nr:WXG100 family type VII secretion target [Microcella daejeonensis]WAB82637.1 WXG100 family type VII secretion target [Microcella daejeonensis]WAB84813.1 WXG100 family type VII secretion target [Microcella daejeonensis]
MADFKATYSEMERMASRLEAGREDIAEILRSLKSEVEALTNDEFRTQQASGKFNDGYGELTEGLKSAIEGIRDMGESLTKMMRAIQDTDAALAGN